MAHLSALPFKHGFKATQSSCDSSCPGGNGGKCGEPAPGFRAESGAFCKGSNRCARRKGGLLRRVSMFKPLFDPPLSAVFKGNRYKVFGGCNPASNPKRFVSEPRTGFRFPFGFPKPQVASRAETRKRIQLGEFVLWL